MTEGRYFEMKSVWIDTDTGVDDAAALLACLRLPGTKLVGASAVAGNAELRYTFVNCRNVLALGGRSDIPVYPGSSAPLLRPLRTAARVHGENGLGMAVLAESTAEKETLAAWDAIYEAACTYPGELELIALGPLTNVAKLILMYPDVKKYLKRILIMGGAAQGGNVTPCAEFNILVDPDAAEIVFQSGIPIVLCPLDVTMKAYLTPEEYASIAGGTGLRAKLFADSMVGARRLYEAVNEGRHPIHDVCPVLYTCYPEKFRTVKCGVHVETKGVYTCGKTVTDIWSDQKFGFINAVVCLDIDRPFFVEKVREALEDA